MIFIALFVNRLTDVENCDGRIHLVFECIDMSLVKYIQDSQSRGGMTMDEIKVLAPPPPSNSSLSPTNSS